MAVLVHDFIPVFRSREIGHCCFALYSDARPFRRRAVQPQSSQQRILTYILLVFVFNVPFDYLMIRAHSIRAGDFLYVSGIMWCPALAAMAVLKLNGRKLSEIGWGWGKPKYQLLAWLIPFVYSTITYVIVQASDLCAVPNPALVQRIASQMAPDMSRSLAMLIYIVLTGSFGLVISGALALGEEIGWRGFMVPELSKPQSFTSTALLTR